MLNDMLEMLRDIAGDDDTDFMLDLLESYRSHTPALLLQIEAAHSQGKVADIGKAAHQLKSSSTMIGCTAFSVQCGDLENACKAAVPHPSTLTEYVEAIQQTYPSIAAAIDALIQQLRRPFGSAPPVQRSSFGLNA